MGKLIVYRGAKEICAAVGIPWKELNLFVKKDKLPAFKLNGRGPWLALPDDLERWMQKQRDSYLGK